MLANWLRCPWSFGGWLGGAGICLGSDISEVIGGVSVYFGVGRHVGKRDDDLEEEMMRCGATSLIVVC